MDKKIETLKKWSEDSNELTTKVCCRRLDIEPSQFYYICKKHKINFTHIPKKGGRTYGAKDTKKRTRRCANNQITTQTGGQESVDNQYFERKMKQIMDI